MFETDFANPGSLKSGEYLRDHVLATARRLCPAERPALVEAMARWLESRTEPYTFLAAEVAQQLELHELSPDLAELRTCIATGAAFASAPAAVRTMYERRLDDVLSILLGPRHSS